MTDDKQETKKPRLEKYIPEEEELVEEAITDTYHNPSKLIRISTWANTISWIVLVVAALLGIVQLYLNMNQVKQFTQIPPIAYIYYVGDGIQAILVGIFYFIVLQAVSEGINILLDIHENTTTESE